MFRFRGTFENKWARRTLFRSLDLLLEVLLEIIVKISGNPKEFALSRNYYSGGIIAQHRSLNRSKPRWGVCHARFKSIEKILFKIIEIIVKIDAKKILRISVDTSPACSGHSNYGLRPDKNNRIGSNLYIGWSRAEGLELFFSKATLKVLLVLVDHLQLHVYHICKIRQKI